MNPMQDLIVPKLHHSAASSSPVRQGNHLRAADASRSPFLTSHCCMTFAPCEEEEVKAEEALIAKLREEKEDRRVRWLWPQSEGVAPKGNYQA